MQELMDNSEENIPNKAPNQQIDNNDQKTLNGIIKSDSTVIQIEHNKNHQKNSFSNVHKYKQNKKRSFTKDDFIFLHKIG